VITSNRGRSRHAQRVARRRHDDVGRRVLVNGGDAILVAGQGKGGFRWQDRGPPKVGPFGIEAKQHWPAFQGTVRPSEGASGSRHDLRLATPSRLTPTRGAATLGGPSGERLRGHRASELDRDAVSGPSQVVRITRNLTLDRTLTLPSRQTREQTSFQSNGGCRYVTPGSGTAHRRYAGARSRGGMNLSPDWYSSSKSPETTIKD
jgi:hypothetical protein